MGQYHKLINLDKKEAVEPYAIGLGAKQWEHLGEAGLDTALYVLLIASPARGGGDLEEIRDVTGRWVGDRVVVVGDYTEDSDIPNSPIPASKLYHSDEIENISPMVANAIGAIFGYTYDGEGWKDRIPDPSHWLHKMAG